MKTVETILLVDDDPLDLTILEDLLQEINNGSCHIIKTMGASSALDVIRSGTEIDLLLMDVCMPGVDGPLFLRRLSEASFRSRIILVSSSSTTLMHSIGELGRSHGLNMLGFVQKPVSPHGLKELMAGSKIPVATSQVVIPYSPNNSSGLDLSLERLRIAIDTGEIRPWYQPKLDSSKLRMLGVEALARWQLPNGLVINPGHFIPAIENQGLADVLFDSLLRQVLQDMARWRASGRYFKAAVNLSVDSAHNLSLPERIADLVHHYAVPPEQLIIEITESQLMADKSKVLETLSRISLKGLALSIDDFGTGYSGLSQLATLPFAELKVDSSFVQHARDDHKSMAILKTIVTFGRGLGMDVVAEGVETFEQLDTLRELGATQIQGYLTARPMPEEKLITWIDNWRPGLINAPGCSRPFVLLIVDDSRVIRSAIKREIANRINKEGLDILQAENGEQAIEIAAKTIIDGATLDFHMPGLNGIELLKRLRNLSPTTRCVLLTAELSEIVAREAVASGALYLPKPLSPHLLDRALQHFFDY